MTTDTRSPAELPDMSDSADRKAVFARALLRDALHVLCPDVDPGAEHRARLTQQRLRDRGEEIARAHLFHHDVLEGPFHDLQLREPRYRGECALRERHARHHGAVAAL